MTPKKQVWWICAEMLKFKPDLWPRYSHNHLSIPFVQSFSSSSIVLPTQSLLITKNKLALTPPPRDVSWSSPIPSPPSLRRVLLVGDFPLLHVVVSGVIHERRASEKRAGRRGGGGRGEGEDGRQRQIAAFNRLPWGAAEGDREREKTHMEGEGRRGDREKETRIVARRWWGGKKKEARRLARWGRLERTRPVQKKRTRLA